MFSALESFEEPLLHCEAFPLPTEGWHTSGKTVYAYTDETCISQISQYQGAIMAARQSQEWLSGLPDSLWSDNGDGSESCSMSLQRFALCKAHVNFESKIKSLLHEHNFSSIS